MKKISIIGIILIIIGLIFSIYAYNRIEINYNNEINFKNNQILIDDFRGDIKIIKGEQNTIKYSDNVEVETISNKVNITSIGNNNLGAIKIIYKDEIFIDIVDIFGKISSDLENNSKINIDDFIGIITIKTNSNVALNTSDNIAPISMKNINKNSDKTVNISINDTFGRVKISGK